MRITHVCSLAVTLCLFPAVAFSQTCAPGTSSNEAKIFGSRSLAFALGRGSAPTIEAAGTIRGGVEFVMVPHISDATAQPTSCRSGKGPENVNAVPAIGRGRISLALPAGLSMEAAWIPPVELQGMSANLVSVAVGYTRMVGSFAVAVRAHTTLGHLSGPITCSDDDLKDPASECFGGTLSDDRYRPNIAGADVAIGRGAPDSRFAWYVGAGFSRLTPRFRVNFRNQAGDLDTTKVRVDLTRVPIYGGAHWRLANRLGSAAEVYATPDDGATIRVLFDVLLRRAK